MRMDSLLMLRMLVMEFVVLALMALLAMAMPMDLAASNVIYETLLCSFSTNIKYIVGFLEFISKRFS